MLSVRQKELKRNRDIRERGRTFSDRVEEEARKRHLESLVKQYNFTILALDKKVSDLKQVLGSGHMEALKLYAADRLSKLIVEKFKESAEDLFDSETVNMMDTVINACITAKNVMLLPNKVVQAFNHVMDLVEFSIDVYESHNAPSFGGPAPDLIVSTNVYWSPRTEFKINQVIHPGFETNLRKLEAEYKKEVM